MVSPRDGSGRGARHNGETDTNGKRYELTAAGRDGTRGSVAAVPTADPPAARRLMLKVLLRRRSESRTRKVITEAAHGVAPQLKAHRRAPRTAADDRSRGREVRDA